MHYGAYSENMEIKHSFIQRPKLCIIIIIITLNKISYITLIETSAFPQYLLVIYQSCIVFILCGRTYFKYDTSGFWYSYFNIYF